jgi:sortase (surface protein transpeptidase)
MRKGTGLRATWALAGAVLLVMTVSSEALGMTPPTRSAAPAEEGRPSPSLTLGANLDRSEVAPNRELARTSAVAAAFARAHPIKHRKVSRPAKKKTVVHPAVVHHTTTVVKNHLWIAALGVSRTVYWFPCSRSTAPGPYVYRWGCAGRNNVYLLGHASGVFAALHDAYVAGTLKVGMVAKYADANGHITRYRVTKWAVTSPSNISWSYATSTKTMTLQTCFGSNSQYRLDIRLVAF